MIPSVVATSAYMRTICVLLGLSFCLSIHAADYIGTMRMESGFELRNVRVELDPSGRLTLFDVKFARLMPVRVDVVIPHVQQRKQGAQTLLSGDGIVPMVNRKSHPDRIVKKLHGHADKQSLSFSCLLGGKALRFEGKSK